MHSSGICTKVPKEKLKLGNSQVPNVDHIRRRHSGDEEISISTYSNIKMFYFIFCFSSKFSKFYQTDKHNTCYVQTN